MKKIVLIALFGLTTFILAACGNESAEEVFTNATEAAKKIESAEMIMVVSQEMNLPGEDTNLIVDSEMEGSVINDPIALYQKGTVSMSAEGMGSEEPLEMETEIYFVDEEIYMFESLTGQWIKADETLVPIDMITSQQPDITEQLEMMEKYVEDFTLEDTKEEYTFTLTADGEAYKELSKEMLSEYMPEELTSQIGDLSSMLEDMTINSLEFEMILDKETYEMKHYNMDLDMTMTVEGQELNIVQSIDTEYTGLNTVEAIEVPQEIKDSAIDSSGF